MPAGKMVTLGSFFGVIKTATKPDVGPGIRYDKANSEVSPGEAVATRYPEMSEFAVGSK